MSLNDITHPILYSAKDLEAAFENNSERQLLKVLKNNSFLF